MALIRVSRLCYRVDGFALQDISLEVQEGEYLVILGPTGSGKTMLLECLCGLNRIDGGTVDIAGREVTHLEPRDRRLGYLPQDYALFPHLTVAGNVAFGLRMRRRRAEERQGRVEEVLTLTGVAHLADRYPEHLSGGEKQRAALARALAVEPQVLLLDEPVSAIDEQSRDALCRELKRLHQAVGMTTVHVCHNFREMLTVADRVAVISDGRMCQVGTPQEVMEQPASRFVAGFVQAENVISARASREGPLTKLTCEGGFVCLSAMEAEGDVHFVIRPENICLHRRTEDVEPESTNAFNCRIANVLDLGAVVHVTAETATGLVLTILLGKSRHRELGVRAGDRMVVAFPADAVHIVTE